MGPADIVKTLQDTHSQQMEALKRLGEKLDGLGMVLAAIEINTRWESEEEN